MENTRQFGIQHTTYSDLSVPMMFSGDSSKIFIHSDVWIGQVALYFRVWQYKKGAVIGANSVVSGNIESYGIYAGAEQDALKKDWTKMNFIPRILNRLSVLEFFNLYSKVTINNVSFKIPVLHSIGFGNRGDTEPWLNKVFANLLTADPLFIDVGVNLGQTLLKSKNQ